jgi:hypothetical protein
MVGSMPQGEVFSEAVILSHWECPGHGKSTQSENPLTLTLSQRE